jgi:uncharacterized membrane protein
VTARFCSFCGSPVVAGATFCSSCGAAVGGSPPLASAPGSLPTFASPVGGPPTPYPPGFGVAGGPTPSSRSADLSALSSVTVAAVLALVGSLVGLIVFLGTSASTILTTSTNGTTTSFSVSLTGLYLLAATAGTSLVLTIVEVIFYRSAFKTLAPHDSRFSTPAKLVLLILVGFVLVLLLGAAILDVVYQAIVCAGAGNPITSSCIDLGTLLALVGLLLVVAIVVLVGYIGLLIGIWRLGTRYGESLFKVGAVLLIIPLLSVVGVILILVAARSSRAKIGGAAVPTTFG